MRDTPTYHVGRALVRHRLALGVERDAMIRHAGPGMDHQVRWIENAACPSVLRLDWWHYTMIEAYEALDDPPPVPAGQREQWWSDEIDTDLWHAASLRRRTVSWWWAPRRAPQGTGALCYLCDTLIHPYDIGRGVTRPVRLAVMTHRATHISVLPDGTTTLRKEAS